jgi:transglutaminase-like putative cysteine protease
MRTDRLTAIDADVPEAPDAEPAPVLAPATRRRVAETLLGALACWLAAAMFAPVFGSLRTFAVPTVAATAGALIVSLLAGRRNLALRWTLVVSVLAAALFVSYTVLVGSLAFGVVPGADTLSGLRRGIGDGFAQMLDGSFPLGEDTLPLVFVTLCTWAATAAAAELVRRTRLASAPIVAPIALAGLAMPVVAPDQPPAAWHIGALLAICLVLVLVRAVPDPKTTGTVIGAKVEGLAEFHSRSLLSARLSLGLPIIALVAVLAPVLGALATTRDPVDPRELRDEVVESVRVADPLGEYKRIAGQTPARPAFQVRIEGATAQEVARVAIVRLDSYDGVRFGTTDRYEPVGSWLVPAADRPTVGRDITLQFSNTDLDAPWLPTGAVPLRTDLRGVSYAPSSGDLLASGTVKGLSYDVRARLVAPTLGELATAGVDLSPEADPYRSLPGGLPPSLGRVASEATQGAANPAEALDKLTTFLRTGFALDATAPAGHTAGRLEQFLRVDRRGSPEQFAAAFAVMARTLGYPTRVVVGYKLTANDAGQSRALEFVTSASYHAWVEVRFNGLGWVAYDPTPATGTTAPPTPGATTGSPDTVTPSGGAEQRTPRELGPSEADLADLDGSGWLRTAAIVAAVVGGAALVVALVVGSIVGAKAFRRRRRRRRASTADRVIGAWDEVVDRLVELHVPISTSMTPRDITALTRARYGTAATLPLSFLVPDVGRAVFGPTPPGEELAERAWERALEFEQNLALTLNRRQRWQARLSLRSLRDLDDGSRAAERDAAPRPDAGTDGSGADRRLDAPDPLDTPVPADV